jgi:hypothetical protein
MILVTDISDETVLTQLTSSKDTNHEFDAGSHLSFHNFDVNSGCE